MNLRITVTLKPQTVEGALKQPSQTKITLKGDASITLKFTAKMLLDLIQTASKINVKIDKLEG